MFYPRNCPNFLGFLQIFCLCWTWFLCMHNSNWKASPKCKTNSHCRCLWGFKNRNAAQTGNYLSSEVWLFELLEPPSLWEIYCEMYSVQNCNENRKVAQTAICLPVVQTGLSADRWLFELLQLQSLLKMCFEMYSVQNCNQYRKVSQTTHTK